MFTTALCIVLAGVVLYLLLKDRLDRSISLINAKVKRQQRARSRQLTRAIASFETTVDAAIEEFEARSQASTDRSETAEAMSKKALAAAVEMSRRFDRGERPKEDRPIHSLKDMRELADNRAAVKIAEIKDRNEKLRREDAERDAKIRETEVLETPTA